MLTIVLPAYGREAFTKRFVDHADKLPFLIELDEGETLPREQYFAAVRDAVHRVNTPYVMLCDNDDLPTEELNLCWQYLEGHPDYVCASGRIEGFRMWPDPVTGPRSAVTGQYSPYDTPANYEQESVNDRVLAGFDNSWSYYAVYRTKALQTIRDEVCDLGLINLQVHEKFCAMRALTLGKAQCFRYFTTLYRQHGTGSGAVWGPPSIPEVHKVLDVMFRQGVNPNFLHDRWDEWYADRDRYFRSPVRKAITKIWQWLPHPSLCLD